MAFVPHRPAQCFRIGGVPEAHREAFACDKLRTVGTEGNASNRIVVPHRLAEWSASAGVPKPRRLVRACRREPRTVRVEGGDPHLIAVAHRLTERFAGLGIPQTRRLVGARCGEPRTVRTENDSPDRCRDIMFHRLAQRSVSGEIQQPHCIAAHGGNSSAITAEGQEPNLVVVIDRLAQRFARRGVPQADRWAACRCEPNAIRTESHRRYRPIVPD